MSRVAVVIVAGGTGERMGASMPKQFLPLRGRAILLRTIDVFAKSIVDAHIVVVLPASHIGAWQDICANACDVAPHKIVVGGATRFESVKNGVEAVPSTDIIAVQDGVRPLATSELIDQIINVAIEHGSAIPVVEPVDSFRVVGQCGSHIVDRATLRAVQTPQIFRAQWLKDAYRQPYNTTFTDDASVVEQAGRSVTLCLGSRENIKITTPLDMTIAEAIIDMRSNEKKV